MRTNVTLANYAGNQIIDNNSCQGYYACYGALDSVGYKSWYENTCS